MSFSNDRQADAGLERFVSAQAGGVYEQALAELRQGRKQSHWMWFVFPQIRGLGRSETARFYAIRDRDEAREYLNHPLLGRRLEECARALLAHEGLGAHAIFGYPDDRKLRSSMSLFALVSPPGSVFEQVLARYFNGERDAATVEIAGSGAD